MNRQFYRRSMMRIVITSVLAALVLQTSSSRVANTADPHDIQRIFDWLTKAPDNCHGPTAHQFDIYWYKSTCFHEAIPLISNKVHRSNRSANECVAWAIHEAMKGDKWRAIAWLDIAEIHDPGAVAFINANRKAVYEYMMSNYVAVWKDAVPEGHMFSVSAQALKQGGAYKDDVLEDCVENDAISLIEIPAGLGVTICDDETGEGDDDNLCLSFGPGIHGPGALGPLHDEVNYVRVYRLP